MIKLTPVLILAAALASPLGAHPHIFVDTGLDLRFDSDGRLSEVKITWAYDDFYSLLITEDRGLDPDFDGVLTEAELAGLVGFDMQWTEGFNGDLVVLQEGRELKLSEPMGATAVYANGRITTSHVRQVDPDQTFGEPIDIKPYDATFYTAYDVSLPVTLEGFDACRQRVLMPDIDAKLVQLRNELAALDALATPEDENLPDIGSLLASTVRVTCD